MSARALGWLAVLVLALAPLLVPGSEGRDRPPRPARPLQRLLGPVASLAASAQWVRVHLALREGRPELAYARAETALALDPGSAAGWQYLATHLAFDRGSPALEPDPARRLAWILAALDVVERGTAVSERPEVLHFLRGWILSVRVALDGELDWPGGPRGAWREAAESYERAARLGHPQGADFARAARAELAD